MRTVCGLDVHKDSVFLCILHDSGEIIEKVFGVLTHQLRDMRRPYFYLQFSIFNPLRSFFLVR